VNISGRGLELVDVPESSATGRFGVNFGPLIPIIDGHIGRVHRVVEGTIDALSNFDGKSLPRI
jgi:hypothetical protein